MRLRRSRLILVIAALAALLYISSFLYLGRYAHTTFYTIGEMAPDEEGWLDWVQNIPPTPEFCFYFSYNQTWNRVAYYFYYPLAGGLEWSGTWIFMEDARGLPGLPLSEGVVAWMQLALGISDE